MITRNPRTASLVCMACMLFFASSPALAGKGVSLEGSFELKGKKEILFHSLGLKQIVYPVVPDKKALKLAALHEGVKVSLYAKEVKKAGKTWLKVESVSEEHCGTVSATKVKGKLVYTLETIADTIPLIANKQAKEASKDNSDPCTRVWGVRVRKAGKIYLKLAGWEGVDEEDLPQ